MLSGLNHPGSPLASFLSKGLPSRRQPPRKVDRGQLLSQLWSGGTRRAEQERAWTAGGGGWPVVIWGLPGEELSSHTQCLGGVGAVRSRVATAPPGLILAFVSLQKSALIVQGPREVKKRELVFLQFRLNESSEDFSAIDYLLFSSFQEFLHRWPSKSTAGLPIPGRGQTLRAAMTHRPGGLTWSSVALGDLSSQSAAGLVSCVFRLVGWEAWSCRCRAKAGGAAGTSCAPRVPGPSQVSPAVSGAVCLALSVCLPRVFNMGMKVLVCPGGGGHPLVPSLGPGVLTGTGNIFLPSPSQRDSGLWVPLSLGLH